MPGSKRQSINPLSLPFTKVKPDILDIHERDTHVSSVFPMKHLQVLVANQLFETVCGSKISQRIFEINPAFLPVNPPLMPVNPAFLAVNPPSVHRPSRTSRLAVAGAAQRAVRFR
jgi:hypothetical protein